MEPSRPLCPWDSRGKNTGVGCHALLQGIFLTQWSSPRLLPALAGGFFTTSATWGRAIIGNIPCYQFPWNSLFLPTTVMHVQFQASHPHVTAFQTGWDRAGGNRLFPFQCSLSRRSSQEIPANSKYIAWAWIGQQTHFQTKNTGLKWSQLASCCLVAKSCATLLRSHRL